MQSLSLVAKPRAQEAKKIRKLERVPAVIYGNKVKNLNVDLDYRDFIDTFRKAGESSLISLSVEGEKEKRLVLVHDFQRDRLSDKIIHIDFLQPNLQEKVTVEVPLVVTGEAPAVKDLGGTLVKNVSEVEVSALPQNLPHELTVNVSKIETFEDHILAKDIELPENVELKINPEDIIISVVKQTDFEAELETPIEENVEDIEKIEKEKKEEEVVDEGEPAKEESKEEKPKEEKK